MSNPTVAVMYGKDLRIVRVPWDQKQTLQFDDVICISLIHEDAYSKRKRQQAVIEFDYYTLVWTDTDCYLGGYDDDYYFFSLKEPWKPYGEGFIHRFPFIMPENSMLFEGVMISPEQYAKAKDIFNDRAGDMF